MTCGQAAQVMAHDSAPAATLVGKGGFDIEKVALL